MGLGNLLEVIMHYPLIGGMTGIGHQNEFHVLSTLVCMVTH